MKQKILTITLTLTLTAMAVWAQQYELPKFLIQNSKFKINSVHHFQYTANYNQGYMQPDWVAWELTGAEAQSSKVLCSFRFSADSELPGAYPGSRSYRNSGYDRGHMCPAADCKYSWNARRQSYFYTNICPQRHELNAGAWYQLEQKCRDLAVRFGSIYICCGPIFDSIPHKFSKDSIAIPTSFFKVVLKKYNGKWQSIGFIMPNSTEVSDSIFQYSMSVDEVEQRTGLDFFHNLPDDIESEVERQQNIKDW